MVETVKGVELRFQAKFRQDRSNCDWDITIFRFFQDGGRRHLGFLKFQRSGTGNSLVTADGKFSPTRNTTMKKFILIGYSTADFVDSA